MDGNKKMINRWWKTRSLNQKVKKDEAVSATTKIVCPEANTVSAAPQVKPELPLPVCWNKMDMSSKHVMRDTQEAGFHVGIGLWIHNNITAHLYQLDQ
ncbi:hypothetical protein OIU74_025333 [Salix koriyanagi]|uniref:Uncharacterized protein n=1 Tax=Salix koriyanagi TaxID=2511006 RepID=A0A9Q0W3P5_9ROSI|nr:hypothetical protein OIU74_025333 [Salix koriyanagi]